MESLRELFKIGKGPSSSHTMGPERAANIIKKRFGENAEYVVDLYGSLSMTGKGHLTDYIIHETLGENCQVNFCEETLPFHPNGMVFHIYQDGELKDDITAYSVGGGSIVWEGEDDFSLSRKSRTPQRWTWTAPASSARRLRHRPAPACSRMLPLRLSRSRQQSRSPRATSARTMQPSMF